MLVISVSVWANSVYTQTFDQSIDTVHAKLLRSFEDAHLIVVSQIDILEKFKGAGLPEKFGKNFNTNKLTGIKAVIACNGWFGNEVANTDPKMMAFCPIRVTLVEQAGKTSVMYVRPTVAPQESAAFATLQKLEDKVVAAIKHID